MNLSTIASALLSPFKQEASANQAPKDFLRGILKRVMLNAALRPRGSKKPIGKTSPVFGEHLVKESAIRSLEAREKQFSIKVKLPDGRHRYFLKNGEMVDRLAQ